MALLTEDQHAEFKEAFRLLDTEEKGEVTLKQLNIVFDSMGVYPTEEELNDMMKLLSFDRETFDYHDFITFMALAMDYLHLQEEPNMILLKSEKKNGFMTLQERSTDKLDDMFKMFANEQTGTVTRESYQNALQNMGESITTSDVDELFQEIGSDELSFDDFVHHMQNITFHSL